MKKLLSLVCAGVLLLGITACTKKKDDNLKVINYIVRAKVKGMDPIYASDAFSSKEVARVYEGLLEYHYLKRPFELKPNLAAEMPKISADGLTYTFKVKQGVKFHDDKAFPNGKGRELVAEDFVYSIKRLADPKLQGLGWWLLQNKVVGLDEWRKKYASADKVDYSEEVEGLKTLDKYTLQFKLKKPFPQFLYSLAMPFTFAVAKEVVGMYGQEFLNHPVGTGPFILPEFKQSNKIIYVKNPNFREKLYPTEAAEEFKKMGFLKDAGKRLPLIDKIIVNIIIETQPRWLNFQKGRIDFLGIPKDNFDAAIIPGKGLSDRLQKKGVRLTITPALDVTYIAFNHDNNVFKENKKLRQALSLAYNSTESNKMFYNSTALPAQSIIPPGIPGYIKSMINPYVGPNLEKAKKLLEEAGYPSGKGLPEITYDTSAGTTQRQMGEFVKRKMEKIGVKVKVRTNTWPEFTRKILRRDVMMWGISWVGDYPDAENFLQLVYGPNRTPGANASGYDNPEFNKLFEKSAIMQDSPERTALYEQMNKIFVEEVPWILGVHRQNYTLIHSWLKNYIRSDFEAGREQYINIDMKEKKEMIKKFN